MPGAVASPWEVTAFYVQKGGSNGCKADRQAKEKDHSRLR